MVFPQIHTLIPIFRLVGRLDEMKTMLGRLPFRVLPSRLYLQYFLDFHLHSFSIVFIYFSYLSLVSEVVFLFSLSRSARCSHVQ